MNCLPCFSKDDKDITHHPPREQHCRAVKDTCAAVAGAHVSSTAAPAATAHVPEACRLAPNGPAAASSSTTKAFNFRELAMATKNFRQECQIGEGGFGRVFKGKLQCGKIVAVKQLDRNRRQGNKEFVDEVLKLSQLQHPNLVRLIGCCADGDQRLLVYEFMPMGSLDDNLFGDWPDKKPLDWTTRMKIASGAAKGLEYLHEKVNPPMIYRDLKPSNILLDENFDPKLSDFGLAKLEATGSNLNPASRVVGTYGYSAPEYSGGGDLTVKSDIYCFGVVLLELITGRKVIDTTRPNDEQNLVTWAQPIFRDPKRFPDLADPRLDKQFPLTSLNQAVGIAAMCLQEEPAVRPLVGDVVSALGFLSSVPPDSVPFASQPNGFTPPPEQKMDYEREVQNQPTNPDKGSSHHDDGSTSDDGSQDEESDQEVEEQKVEESHLNSGRLSVAHSDDDDSDGSDAESMESNHHDNEDKTEKTGDRETSMEQSESEKSEGGDMSFMHGSSQRSSSSGEEKGSWPSKPVVTFREPNLSLRCSSNIDSSEEESSFNSQPAPRREATDSSSSSDEESSSSEYEDESFQKKGSSKPTKNPKRSTSCDQDEDRPNGGPHLRHLCTR